MTIKPWQLIMKNYLWDLEAERPHYPACPNCLTKLITAITWPGEIVRVSVFCPHCRLSGPSVSEDEAQSIPLQSVEARRRWNQMIERTYHLAHGTIPTQRKKED